MPPKENEIGYRRNGKKQACEPCRKGKLACDHGAPFCGRCMRRKTTARCIYHPAPMTRNRPSTTMVTPLQSPTIATDQAGQLHSSESLETSHPPSFQSPAELLPSNTSHDGPNAAIAPEVHATQKSVIKRDIFSTWKPKAGWSDMVFRRSARYYGPTSFAAIFSEHHEDLLDIGEDIRKHPGAWPFGVPLLGRERPNGPTARTKQTVKALLNIPSREVCDMLLANFDSIRETSLNPVMIGHCITSLWSTFEIELSGPQEEEPMARIADVLFDNEETPLAPSPDDPTEWMNTFTGSNIRFEMMGMLFCFFGLGFMSLQDWDPVFKAPENDGRDRKQTAWRMKECAGVCLKMCDDSETVNFLVTALILSLKRLETGCTGDDTYSIRRLHGDLITTSITSGLHRLPDYATCKVTAASEYKRRLFCAIYCNDKTHASLNGTPPLLTRLFCDVQPCLDLPSGAIFLPEDELGLELDKLDANGWKKSDKPDDIYYPATILRIKVQLCTSREEILELALGVNVDGSEGRINDLHRRSFEMYQAIPPQLQYYSEGKIPKGSTGDLLFEQSHVLLQYLQNEFLIDRVAIARGFANGQGLLDTAMEMIDISMMFWIKRDQLMRFSHSFDWIITYYGIPSAGVICIELLKDAVGRSSIQFSRSDGIQKLTLFIAFLEWVRPTDGNYTLAQRLRNVVRRVLDHVLEPSQQEVRGEEGNELPFDPMLAPFNETNDLDWLNTIDWTQGSWMDFN